jgi:hypothetical protein
LRRGCRWGMRLDGCPRPSRTRRLCSTVSSPSPVFPLFLSLWAVVCCRLRAVRFVDVCVPQAPAPSGPVPPGGRNQLHSDRRVVLVATVRAAPVGVESRGGPRWAQHEGGRKMGCGLTARQCCTLPHSQSDSQSWLSPECCASSFPRRVAALSHPPVACARSLSSNARCLCALRLDL